MARLMTVLKKVPPHNWKVFKMAVCRQPVKKIQLKREKRVLQPKSE